MRYLLEDDFFDFIYMTDVIHHVPDLRMMFTELMRVLKPGGLVCILAESHHQLETRFWVEFFPTTVEVEKKRYPDIPVIVETAKAVGFHEYETVITDTESETIVSENFLKLVVNKGYSMFKLIEETDYQTGLASLKEAFTNKAVIHSNHGETLLWLKGGTRYDRQNIAIRGIIS